jgi:RimJ/RimL family protein N-acetyltransferase
VEGPVAVLTNASADLSWFSEELRWEVEHLSDRRPIAVVLDEGAPTCVCLPALVTERHWDVSIDTAEDFRRGGRAQSAFKRLEAEMRRRGQQPVWGAAESNVASLALAARLGFERVGEVTVFDLAEVPR